MAGALIAIAAGVSLGLFQSLNAKAGDHVPIRKATFTILAVSAAVVTVAAVFSGSGDVYFHMPPAAYGYFALAGAVHFIVGWSLLSMSQRRVGAGGTGSLIGTVPIFTAIVGAVFLQEYLSLAELLGIGLVVAGVVLVSNR